MWVLSSTGSQSTVCTSHFHQTEQGALIDYYKEINTKTVTVIFVTQNKKKECNIDKQENVKMQDNSLNGSHGFWICELTKKRSGEFGMFCIHEAVRTDFF